jgi:ribosome-associated translation inhibitor RaiA
MKTGRARILEMVKDGKISIEQADELLEALENAVPNTPARTSPFEASPLEPEHKPRVEVRISRNTNGGKYNFEQMIELGKFGVSPKFIRQIAEVGLTDLGFEDVIELGKFGISPKFVLEMRQLSEEFDLGELNFERIIELGKYGVSAKFVREMIETQMIDFSLPTKQWAQVEPDDERREKLQAKLHNALAAHLHAKHEREREKLQAKLEEAQHRLSQAKTDQERETLERIIEAVVEKLERQLSQVDSTQP